MFGKGGPIHNLGAGVFSTHEVDFGGGVTIGHDARFGLFLIGYGKVCCPAYVNVV